MKRRVLHCVYSGLGGHAAVLFTMLDSQMRADFDHHVLFFGIEDLCLGYGARCAELGIPFTYVKKSGRLALASHAKILTLIANVRPDVLMIHGTTLAIPLLLARRLIRGRWAVVVRESQSNQYKSTAQWLGSFLSVHLADAVVYLTREYALEVRNRIRFPGHFRRTMVIPNGVALPDVVSSVQDSPGPLRLAMVSRLVPLKDHGTLIEAMRTLVADRGHSLHLTIAGDGPTRGALEDRVERAGLDDVVAFVGTLSHEQVMSLLSRTDIYVHCTYGEGMSNSILQAMASCLPIVASDVMGVSNMVVDGEECLLVPVEDVEALVSAIEVLIESPDLRYSIGAKAHARVDAELSQARVGADYRALFARMCTLERGKKLRASAG